MWNKWPPLYRGPFSLFLNFIQVFLIYSVYIYRYRYKYTSFPPYAMKIIEYRSLCYTVGLCWLSILYIQVCLCSFQAPNLSFPTLSPLVTLNVFSMSVSLFPWIWANSGRQWTEEPGVLQSTGSQRVRHNLVTEQQRGYFCFVCKFFCISLLGSTYKWYQTVFAFLYLTSLIIIISRSRHVYTDCWKWHHFILF